MQMRNEQGAGCRFVALDRQHFLGFSPSVSVYTRWRAPDNRRSGNYLGLGQFLCGDHRTDKFPGVRSHVCLDQKKVKKNITSNI